MTLDRNDPRWTAYVLDELDASERALFEREIAADPHAREALAEVRESVTMLEEALSPGTLPRLTEAQRQEVLAHVPKTASAGGERRRFATWTLAAGLAASVLIGVVTVRVVRDIPDPAGSGRFATEVANAIEPADENDALAGREVARPQESDATQAPTATMPPAEPPAPRAEAPTESRLAIANESETGSALTGTVTDATGARIPGAQVTARNTQTNGETTVMTNQSGAYNIPQLAVPGPYELTVSLPGFQTSRIEDIEVGADETYRYNATLEVAGATGHVEVTADLANRLLESSASVGQVSPSIVNLERGGGRGVVGGQISSLAPEPAAAPPAAFADQTRPRFSTEEYNRIIDNPFLAVSEEPLSTFSTDVDTASYANVRRFLNQRALPPPDAVRIEEMVNYFAYDYAPPQDGRPVRIHAEVAGAPWAPQHRLVRIGIQGDEIAPNERGASNLVFLIDVSGSMNSPDKLPLLVDGMRLLVQQLGNDDRVAVVVYAGSAGIVLESTSGTQANRILSALDRLRAGGSTNGGAGIQLAYDVVTRNFIEGGVNRVILATDGDLNVGVTNTGDLTRLIEEKAGTGVFLSVLGFGTGNYNDAGLEALADRGNGNYAYIDSIREARKVLVEEMESTLVTIAKDVKIQVEFNPAEVAAYRLLGYENRALENQDFNDDTVDAGEIGAGHTVTALFEIVPVGVAIDLPGVDPLRYQAALAPTDRASSGELLTVAVRYKEPDGEDSLRIEAPVVDRGQAFEAASTDHRFAAAVAGFGMLLRDSPYKGSATFDSILRIAEGSLGSDAGGYRQEFAELVRRARALEDLN